ncbi:mandelate racemase/muconate lactonizing enzyme family protein [Devosia alba]|uniref:mandelate racemase/muconate lactonizing enzyme family protein n=1 Tax=Devosia alba TaxID=3152360 RepID=UPI0032676174
MTKIARLHSFIIRYPDPNDFDNLRMTLLLRIDTADGLTGWGEAIAMWPEACRATAQIIHDGLGPVVLGHDATDTDVLWQAMRRHVWWYGEGGIASLAISAVDMALWDIRAQAAGQPLYEVLGGLQHQRLRACASAHVNKATEADCVAEVAGFFAAGFRSTKLGFAKKGMSRIGGDPDTDVNFVAALRRELGPKAEILIDIGNGVRWDVDTAISVTNRMAEQDIGWIEEPLYPTDDAGYRRLKAATCVPVASGEREWTATGYRRLIESGSVDVLGVDPARVEGVTGFLAIDQLAGAGGKIVNAHAWSTALTSAVSLHLSLASANTRLFELKPFPVVVQQGLVEHPIIQIDGWVYPPVGPGLGITIRPDVVQSLTVEDRKSGR